MYIFSLISIYCRRDRRTHANSTLHDADLTGVKLWTETEQKIYARFVTLHRYGLRENIETGTSTISYTAHCHAIKDAGRGGGRFQPSPMRPDEYWYPILYTHIFVTEKCFIHTHKKNLFLSANNGVKIAMQKAYVIYYHSNLIKFIFIVRYQKTFNRQFHKIICSLKNLSVLG